jgi:hypothetical protein
MPNRNICVLIAGMAMLAACGSADRSESNSSVAESSDWQVLFDGKTLAGWRSYGKDAPGPEWIVEDGAIVLAADDSTTSMTGGDLITVDQFENFELQLEWKISAGGNSGVFFGVQEIDGQSVAYETGIEMQILDDDRHADGARRETSAGSCYALYPPLEDVVRPVGEYNVARIVVQDAVVQHWLNGKKIVDYTIDSPDWTARVGASKFADWEHFARYRKGHIALQDHTDRVWFRSIRIRPL